ncbi:hypothetical protein JNK13_07115 [bacterium]|nr:hypothetical protein [bacterium]
MMTSNETALQPTEITDLQSTNWLANLALALFGILIFLIAGEIIARAYLSIPAKKVASDRPVYWYLPEASTDYRNLPVTPEKPAGTYRIIVVGDSFTYGDKVQFDDTFPKRLERLLNLNQNQQKVEVINWGVPGFATYQEVPLVKRAMEKYHADLVILQVTLNDTQLVPYHPKHEFARLKNGKIVFDSKLLEHWALAHLLLERYYAYQFSKEHVAFHFRMLEAKENWNMFSNAVGNIKKYSDEFKTRVLVVLLPMFNSPLDGSYPFIPLHQKFKAEFEKNHLSFVDFFENYRNIPSIRLEVEPGIDGHPNEIAHRISAEAIYRYLKEHDLIPDDVKIKDVAKGVRKQLPQNRA